ncbi:aromatic-ring-hydroxylating dioxygenase [Erysipelothrix larvae]|uniref:Segregation and condensation protein A n=1 Tax=Erysipelothrix larvae TaxID=1514105 RepID=A0A109UH04_9FIRM|nr:segregation/condensation protein A [Erysipelothrix larvae]AMC93393.1 aromatic-ring-hydroxylating dioxygenase [Erysipelothrix larvae]
MAFEVTIEQFSGPLDLMLYLIKDKKLDLFDLNILELANQYADFLNHAKEQKLEIAAEYIAELAGLIEYKSKKLLPRDKSELDVKELEDQETDLVKRLLEYQRYKEVSMELAVRYQERLQQHTKPISVQLLKDIKTSLKDSISYDQTPYDLMNAMVKVMQRFKLANPHEVSIERVEYSVDDRIISLRMEFLNKKVMTLDDLLEKSPNVSFMIVTFLAVLDMLRMGDLLLSTQNDAIYLKGAV